MHKILTDLDVAGTATAQSFNGITGLSSTANDIKPNGTRSAGILNTAARSDHVHEGVAGAVTKIDDLSDVDISTIAPTEGQTLLYDSTSGVFKPGTITGGGTTSGSGYSIIDFGSWPGNNTISINITSQTDILSTSKITLYIKADSTTSDHTENDHIYGAIFITLAHTTPINGVGFTIHATSIEKMQGTFLINWEQTN